MLVSLPQRCLFSVPFNVEQFSELVGEAILLMNDFIFAQEFMEQDVLLLKEVVGKVVILSTVR